MFADDTTVLNFFVITDLVGIGCECTHHHHMCKGPPSLCKREEGITLTLAPFCDYYQILSHGDNLNTNKILVVQVQNIITTIRA